MPKLLPTLLMVLAAVVPTSLAQNATAASNGTTESIDRVGWVWPEARRRSTWDILWSCFTVFLVCSWKCTHLNIPTRAESGAGWHKKWDCVPYWPEGPLLRKWRRKLIWMCTIAIAPELGLALAMRQNLEARKALKCTTDRRWCMAHAFYANMGGFRLKAPRQVTPSQDVIKQVAVQPSPAHEPDADEDRFLRLEDFVKLENMGLVVDMTKEDIKDQSKADAFTKTFALFQSSWLVIQSIARATSGLTITPLELTTMAFIVCALITYILWWDKPYDVERSRTLIYPDSERVQILGLCTAWYEESGGREISAGELGRVDDLTFMGFQDLLLPFEYLQDDGRERQFPWYMLVLYGSGIASSALLLAAWNWDFPSPIIQALWRSFGVVVVVTVLTPLLLFTALFFYILYMPSAGLNTIGVIFFWGLVLLSLISYIISRLALLVLTFYCFTSMPASAYDKVDWTGFIPHFA